MHRSVPERFPSPARSHFFLNNLSPHTCFIFGNKLILQAINKASRFFNHGGSPALATLFRHTSMSN